ncbi:MAG: vWA domain-containing protein [Lishizhenia sp.]
MSSATNIKFWEYVFLSPSWLWLLLILPALLLVQFILKRAYFSSFKFSRNSSELETLETPSLKWILRSANVALYIGLFFLILGLAKPYHPLSVDNNKDYSEGIDIIIALDISQSMKITDFLPDRLQAAKEVAKEFIDNRSQDKIGLVVYEGEAYTACPTTKNHTFLKTCLDNVETGLLEPGTAIGTGLGTAVTRLRSDSLKSKVIILLTDGESNRGQLTPLAAAELAKNKNVRVYTIGVGKDGYVRMPIQTILGQTTTTTYVSIDEKTLKKIAQLTNGAYFRATDKASLRKIYAQIDKLETRKMIENVLQREPPIHPIAFILFGLICVSIYWIINYIVFRKIG